MRDDAQIFMKFSDFAFFIYNNLKLGNFEKKNLFPIDVNGDVAQKL